MNHVNRINQIRHQLAEMNKVIYELNATITALEMELTNQRAGPMATWPNIMYPASGFQSENTRPASIDSYRIVDKLKYMHHIPANVLKYIENFMMLVDDKTTWIHICHLYTQKHGGLSDNCVYLITSDMEYRSGGFHDGIMTFLRTVIKSINYQTPVQIGEIIDIINTHPLRGEILLTAFNSLDTGIIKQISVKYPHLSNMSIYTQYVNPATDWKPSASFTNTQKKEAMEWIESGKVTTVTIESKGMTEVTILNVGGASINWSDRQREYLNGLMDSLHKRLDCKSSFNVVINIPLLRIEHLLLSNPTIFILPNSVQFDYTQIELLSALSKRKIHGDIYYYDLISVVDSIGTPFLIRTDEYASLLAKITGAELNDIIKHVEDIDKTIFCIMGDAIKKCIWNQK